MYMYMYLQSVNTFTLVLSSFFFVRVVMVRDPYLYGRQVMAVHILIAVIVMVTC